MSPHKDITWVLTILSSHVVLVVKNLLASVGDIRDADLIPGLGGSTGGGNPVFLPGESHGQRSLVGYSP